MLHDGKYKMKQASAEYFSYFPSKENPACAHARIKSATWEIQRWDASCASSVQYPPACRNINICDRSLNFSLIHRPKFLFSE